MKNALLIAFAMMASTTAFAHGEMSNQPANAKQSITSLFDYRPSPTDCYLECKPTSGGGDGDGFTKCYNECMARR